MIFRLFVIEAFPGLIGQFNLLIYPLWQTNPVQDRFGFSCKCEKLNTLQKLMEDDSHLLSYASLLFLRLWLERKI